MDHSLSERSENTDHSRKAVKEMKAGLGRPAEAMPAEMRTLLDERR